MAGATAGGGDTSLRVDDIGEESSAVLSDEQTDGAFDYCENDEQDYGSFMPWIRVRANDEQDYGSFMRWIRVRGNDEQDYGSFMPWIRVRRNDEQDYGSFMS